MADRWGRTVPKATRHGRRSVLCAAIAFALVVGLCVTFAISADGDFQQWPSITGSAFVTYLVAVPVLHFAGLFFGLWGLVAQGDSKTLSIFGLLINLCLLGAGLFVLVFLLPSLTEFR